MLTSVAPLFVSCTHFLRAAATDHAHTQRGLLCEPGGPRPRRGIGEALLKHFTKNNATAASPLRVPDRAAPQPRHGDRLEDAVRAALPQLGSGARLISGSFIFIFQQIPETR